MPSWRNGSASPSYVYGLFPSEAGGGCGFDPRRRYSFALLLRFQPEVIFSLCAPYTSIIIILFDILTG